MALVDTPTSGGPGSGHWIPPHIEPGSPVFTPPVLWLLSGTPSFAFAEATAKVSAATKVIGRRRMRLPRSYPGCRSGIPTITGSAPAIDDRRCRPSADSILTPVRVLSVGNMYPPHHH